MGADRGPAPDRGRTRPGRRLLDSMPYPENLDHHFVVDPTKFDFYAMDCYRQLAEDKMAENLADEVIRASTDFDGTERAPMRIAEARITLGVVAARQGDIEQAVHHGEHALAGQRKSLPSLPWSAVTSPAFSRIATQLSGQLRHTSGSFRPSPKRTGLFLVRRTCRTFSIVLAGTSACLPG